MEWLDPVRVSWSAAAIIGQMWIAIQAIRDLLIYSHGFTILFDGVRVYNQMPCGVGS